MSLPIASESRESRINRRWLGAQKGRLFETKIHEHFSKFGNSDTIKCLRENEIIKKYGINVSAIDHYMSYGDKIVLLQDKWTGSSISLRDVDHFIVCVNFIRDSLPPETKIQAIYVSKKAPTKAGLLSLDKHGCFAIYDKNSETLEDSDAMESVISKLEQHILSFFGVDNTVNGDVIKQYQEELNRMSDVEKLLIERLDRFIKFLETSNIEKFGDDLQIQKIIGACVLLKEHGRAIDILCVSNKFKKKLAVHRYCTAGNYKFIDQCFRELNDIVIIGKQMNKFRNASECKLDRRYLILSHNFGEGEEFSTYGKANWKKLVKLNCDELETILDGLRRSNYSIWRMCWECVFSKALGGL
ncbi:MAG: hypothetical protein Hyperionvirus1_70 [Hyperionvirus sp.]|uniref:Uncharacterized protein n=1 Tax=Hyperionvirus sp. TaxID=2487770 RepID=A0A3G5A8J0_9VIRU|nr:MAG: hypothetical protein Hyperionvirus1_70 [Hyperionvirus sp.]